MEVRRGPRGRGGPRPVRVSRGFEVPLLLFELAVLAIQRSLEDDAVLAGLRVQRLHPRPGRGAVEDHLPDLGAQGGRGRGCVLDRAYVVDVELRHGSYLLSVGSCEPREEMPCCVNCGAWSRGA